MERHKNLWRRYTRNTLGLSGMIILLFVLMTQLFDFIVPYGPREISEDILIMPCFKHVMGTDYLGRDIFSQVLEGVRVSLTIGSLSAITAVFIGLLVGAISGYFGGVLDEILMRVTEIFQSFPRLVLALVFAALFGASLWNVILIISILSWSTIARLTRAEILSVKERQFVEASKISGASKLTLIFGEILPNCLTPAIVNLSFLIGGAIKMEAGISFLGIGDPKLMSMGRILYNARMYYTQAWWMAVFPGVFLAIVIIACNLIGDGLNFSLNPRLNK